MDVQHVVESHRAHVVHAIVVRHSDDIAQREEHVRVARLQHVHVQLTI